jgi:tetratricopeptide (TPR) repeat protein
VPSKDSWDIMLYKDLTMGGNVDKYKTENEALRFKVKPSKLNDKAESFTINFDGFKATATTLVMSWENTKVSIGITTDIDATIMKNIEKTIINDSRPFYSAASYYYDNNKDMNLAMEWVTKAINSNPKGYWMYLLKAKIANKLNDKKTAIAAATECNRLATEDKDDAYIKNSNELLAELKK